MTFTQELKFSELTRLLEAVSNTKAVKKRDSYMKDYFDKILKFKADYVKKNPQADSSLLPVIRLILSQEEKERSYGLQEKSLRQLYIKALNLHKTSADAIKITNCSDDRLPNIVNDIMKMRTSDGTLSIHEIDRTLSLFSDNQKLSFQENELRRLILQSNAIDQKWLCKMILKKMNLQLGTTKVLKFFHPKGHELFLKYNHLSRVVELIESGKSEEAMIDVTEVFRPIRSMLCQRFTSSLNKDFLRKEIYQETKMDGERFQLHMKNGEYRYYSRNSHEFSEGFNTFLTPLIKFSTVVHSIILDGEMLVYDTHQSRYFTKGETPVDVKNIKDKSSKFRPCFCAFDILLYNDESYMNRPYTERCQLLQQLFEDRIGVMVKTKPIRIRDVDHMLDLFNTAVEEQEEGIVLKDAQSIYKPGDRQGGWYKVKADYFDGDVVKEFDCVIIGGFYENLNSRNFIHKYLVGAVEKIDEDCMHVYAVGEVSQGVTAQERIKINESLKPHLVEHLGESEVSFNRGKIFFGKKKPHCWIPPDKSIVLECKASELVRTSEQYTSYTFRFPRITNIRRDKLWEESDTLKQFQEMCQENDGRVKKIVMRNVNKDDLIAAPQKKRRTLRSNREIIEGFCRNSEDDEMEVIDNVLDGKEFCVMTTTPKLPSLKQMKKIIKQHGGNITEFPRKGKTFAIIAGSLTRNVNAYMKDKCYNVIDAKWLVNNFGEKGEKTLKDMPSIRPLLDLHFATDEMKESLRNIYDDYGDSYNEEIKTVDELKLLLESMKSENIENDLSEMNFKDLDKEFESFGLKNNFFRNMSAGFFASDNDNVLFHSAKSIFKFRGGNISSFDTENELKIIFIDKDEGIKKIKENISKHLSYGTVLVDYRWILNSNDVGKLLDKCKYCFLI